jgi:hypothetical protein
MHAISKALLERSTCETEYPLWVRLGHSAMSAQCPLYPNKRTSTDATGMSAKCQERTSARLFEHLVGASEQHRWHVEAQRLRGIEVDYQLEFGRLLNWQEAKLVATGSSKRTDNPTSCGLRLATSLCVPKTSSV